MQQPGATITFESLGEGFIAALRDAIARAQRNPLERVTVLTPSPYSSYFLRRALAPGGLFNVTFMRLDDLAEALGPEEDDEERWPLSDLRAAEIAYAAAQEAPFTDALDGLRDHRAFHAALHRTFRDLDTAPGEVIARLENASGVPSQVARAWRIYERRSRAFYNRLSVARRAAGAVAAGDARLDELGRIIVLLVEAPTPQYRPLLDTLVGSENVAVIVGGTHDEEADALVERVLPAAASAASARPESEAAAGTCLVSAPDRATEVRWVVRNVARLVAERNTKLSRIAVLYRDESYGPRVDEALGVAGIRTAGPEPRSLAQQPEGRFVSGLLDAIKSGLARDAVMAWLTGAPVKSPDPSIRVDAARWDAVSRNAGVTRGLEVWRDRLAAYARGRRRRADEAMHAGDLAAEEAAASSTAADHANRLARFIERLAVDSEPPRRGSAWTECCKWARTLVDGYLDTADPGRRERLEAVLRSLAELDAVEGPPPSFERFELLLRDQLERVAGKGRPLGSGVFVAPLRFAVGTDFDAVHILGMTEGSFPPRDSEDPLLPDSERRRVDPEGLELPQRAYRRALARCRYLTALAAAPKRFLLWPRSEMGATRGVGPARWYVEEAERLAGNPVQAGDLSGLRDRAWFEWLGPPEDEVGGLEEVHLADPHDYDLRAVSAWRASGRPAHDVFVASLPGSPLGAALRLESARRGGAWSGWDGNLGAGADAGIPAEAVSPTTLETWAKCPFRYFLAHALSLEPVERPEEVLSISPMDRGLLIHAALDRFDETRREEGLIPAAGDDRARELMLDALHREFRRAERQGVTGKPALWRAERERIERLLLRFLTREAERVQQTGLRPMASELTFGLSGSDLAPVAVNLLDGSSVRFRGRVDRVEVSDDRRTAAVVDYKTGRSDEYRRISQDPVGGGRLLQLPVYAMAAREWLGGDATVRGDYWFVSEREGFRTYGLSLADAEGPMREAVTEIVRGIRGGVFPALPGAPVRGGHENCLYCPFDALCPAARERLWERKQGDPALGTFRSLADLTVRRELAR